MPLSMLKKLEGNVGIEEMPDGDPNQPDAAGPRRSAPRDVNRRFERQVEEALQRERIPVQYHAAVRAYFKRLAESNGPDAPP